MTSDLLPTSRRLRVLVVDDEPRLRALLGDVIPDMDLDVVTARTAEEGLRAIEETPCDIAMLDLNLPVMQGMDLFAILRQRWPNLQVIVMTGFGDLASAREAIRMDVVDFLSKPCHLRDIELALDRARRRIETTHPKPQRAARTADLPPPPAAATLAEVERQQIIEALARHDGNRTRAAAELGISRRTLHYRLREYKDIEKR